ncbi:penicillin acylase family protein [Halochromatium glycolicum]|uniref:penicillin acylase family protein n=1 Tax=Halochromatium glycolicum TaxID=85075 RepID=UPI00190E590C|nr:penicillin acylase family protein [Halochromatium glycolicum]
MATLHPRFRIALLVLAALIAIAVTLSAWWLYRPNPRYAGTLALAGLEQPASVRFGAHAVPSIDAKSIRDMVFAQGFVVARERLWQMDLLRRLAGGRLAELFGEGALRADRFYRTIGLARAADHTFEALEPRWRDLLARYAEGVNAYRDRAIAAMRLPLEYQLLGLAPAPWRPQDSLLVGAYMAWVNASNLREELVFLRLAQRLGTQRALELFPTGPGQPAPEAARALPEYRLKTSRSDAPSSPERLDADPASTSLREPDDRRQPDAFARSTPQAASNAWAVTGRWSEGGALLANDPHLPAQLPAPFFELEMQAPGYHAAGVALPGVPFVLIGHNRQLAWGVTASAADTQDLFLERMSEDGLAVLRPGGGTEPISVRTERIAVLGRESPVQLDVRSTSHGVFIDELVAAPNANPAGLISVQRPERLALKQTLVEADRSLVALFRLNQAQTLDEARAATRDLRQVSLNLLFAHRNGRIAWQVSGLLPVRGRGSGAFPVPGWEAGYGWTGFRPFSENPGLSDPPAERLVNANNAMSESEASPPIGYSWLAPFRAQRIEALLDARGGDARLGDARLGDARLDDAQWGDPQLEHARLGDTDPGTQPGDTELVDTGLGLDAADMARMQSDRVSEEARLYLAALERQLPELRQIDPEAAAIAESELLSWSGRFDQDSRSAALFVMLRPALYRALYADELGPDLEALMGLEHEAYGPLAETMRADRSSFWDDVRTPEKREGPALVWARALHAAKRSLHEALSDEDEPTLAQLRQLTFRHAFAGQPLLGRLFNLGPLGHGGDNGTIDVAIAPLGRPRDIGNVPALRVVYTPNEWSQTRGTLPLGQSGHRFSRFRADQLDDWLAGELHRWAWGGPPAGQSLGTLVLRPGSG